MASAPTRTEHYVSRPDGRVYYYKVGQGEPLVLLHNVELSSFIWEKVIDTFAEHFTCYAIDMPGHDHSDIPPRQYWIEDYSKAVVDVMDEAGLEHTSIAASHGGCVVALDLAATHPQRVTKMVMDGLPYWNLERGRILWEKFWTPLFTDTTSYDIPVKPMEIWEEAVQRNPHLDKEHWEKELEIRQRSARWISLSFEAMTKYDVEATGPRVKAPTLLLYGDGDPLRRAEQRALEGIKGSTHTVVDGVRGGPHWEKPAEFARLSIKFLKGS